MDDRRSMRHRDSFGDDESMPRRFPGRRFSEDEEPRNDRRRRSLLDEDEPNPWERRRFSSGDDDQEPRFPNRRRPSRFGEEDDDMPSRFPGRRGFDDPRDRFRSRNREAEEENAHDPHDSNPDDSLNERGITEDSVLPKNKPEVDRTVTQKETFNQSVRVYQKLNWLIGGKKR